MESNRLAHAGISVGQTTAYCKLGNGTVSNLCQDTVYIHPTAKQCSYNVPIIDNLTSSETSAALSANQGRILNSTVSALEENLINNYVTKEDIDSASNVVGGTIGVQFGGNASIVFEKPFVVCVFSAAQIQSDRILFRPPLMIYPNANNTASVADDGAMNATSGQSSISIFAPNMSIVCYIAVLES